MAAVTETGAGKPNTPFAERNIEGKVIVLTGGSKGIGLALAHNLAARKATLVLTARNGTELAAAVEAIKAASGNPNVEGHVCDQGDRASIKAFGEAVAAKHACVHVLINNASIMPGMRMSPLDEPEEETVAMFRINVDGYFFMTRAILPLLFKCEAGWERTVINTSSAAAFLTEPMDGIGLTGYRMTKAAESALTVSLHQIYVKAGGAGEQVRGDSGNHLHRIINVHPGYVATTLGSETIGVTGDALVSMKAGQGAIPVSEGQDTLLWATCAAGGINSGKFYYLRAEHSW